MSDKPFETNNQPDYVTDISEEVEIIEFEDIPEEHQQRLTKEMLADEYAGFIKITREYFINIADGDGNITGRLATGTIEEQFHGLYHDGKIPVNVKLEKGWTWQVIQLLPEDRGITLSSMCIGYDGKTFQITPVNAEDNENQKSTLHHIFPRKGYKLLTELTSNSDIREAILKMTKLESLADLISTYGINVHANLIPLSELVHTNINRLDSAIVKQLKADAQDDEAISKRWIKANNGKAFTTTQLLQHNPTWAVNLEGIDMQMEFITYATATFVLRGIATSRAHDSMLGSQQQHLSFDDDINLDTTDMDVFSVEATQFTGETERSIDLLHIKLLREIREKRPITFSKVMAQMIDIEMTDIGRIRLFVPDLNANDIQLINQHRSKEA